MDQTDKPGWPLPIKSDIAISELARRLHNVELRTVRKLPGIPSSGPGGAFAVSVPINWHAPMDVSPTYTVATWLTVDLAAAVPDMAVAVLLSISITTSGASTAAVKVRVDDAGSEYPLFSFDPGGIGTSSFAGQYEVPMKFRRFQIYVSSGATGMAITVLGHRRNPVNKTPNGSGGGEGGGDGGGGGGGGASGGGFSSHG